MLSAMLAAPCAPASAPKARPAAVAPPAEASLPAGDAAAGKDKAEAERCLECHGSAGPAQGFSNDADGKFAKLAGQYPAYIVKQMQDFRSGRRQHEFMAMMANTIADADLADIAAYFAAAPAMSGGAAPEREDDAPARRLFTQGDASRQLVACVACHGGRGQGVAGAGPVIGGQGLRYLAQQLYGWRSGARHNSAQGVMNAQARPLSDAEIEALAHYVSAL